MLGLVAELGLEPAALVDVDGLDEHDLAIVGEERDVLLGPAVAARGVQTRPRRRSARREVTGLQEGGDSRSRSSAEGGVVATEREQLGLGPAGFRSQIAWLNLQDGAGAVDQRHPDRRGRRRPAPERGVRPGRARPSSTTRLVRHSAAEHAQQRQEQPAERGHWAESQTGFPRQRCASAPPTSGQQERERGAGRGRVDVAGVERLLAVDLHAHRGPGGGDSPTAARASAIVNEPTARPTVLPPHDALLIDHD